MRTDRAGIVDYFEHFLSLEPSGELVDSVVHVLDEDSALNAGHGEFTINDDDDDDDDGDDGDGDDGDGDGDGERETVETRYTYEYENRDGEWLIVNHHSSWLPDDRQPQTRAGAPGQPRPRQNRSKARAFSASSMPGPSSRTSSITV